MAFRHVGQILTISLLAFVCMSPCKCKAKRPPVEIVPSPAVVVAPPLVSEGRQWVKAVIDQYPEIVWLANADVGKTQEMQDAVNKPYSEQLFGQKFIEFDRTLMSLRCLELILDGSEKSYQAFTAAQPANVRLSKESFQALHEQGISLLSSNYQGMPPAEMLKAVEVALILRDMGKSEKAREIFKKYGVLAPNNDDFYGEAMLVLKDYPRVCRSFLRLTYRSKQLLIKTAPLASYGSPSVFAKLKDSKVAGADPTALSFALFVHTCNAAGAAGHINNTSSLVYTETAHKAMQAMVNACRVLSDPTKTEADAYEVYLSLQ